MKIKVQKDLPDSVLVEITHSTKKPPAAIRATTAELKRLLQLVEITERTGSLFTLEFSLD